MSSSMAPPAALGNTSPVQLCVPKGFLGLEFQNQSATAFRSMTQGNRCKKEESMDWCLLNFTMKLEAEHLCGFWHLWLELVAEVSLHRVQGSWQYSGLDSAALLVLFLQPLSQIPWWTLYGWWKQECSWNGSEWLRGEWSHWGAAGASGKLNPCGFTHGSLYLDRSCPVLPWPSVPPSGHVGRLKVQVLCVFLNLMHRIEKDVGVALSAGVGSASGFTENL